jgi:CRISPR-associated protein Cas1
VKKLLNTLYIATQGAYIHQDGDTLRIQVEGETRLRIPVHTLEGLVCFGAVTMSSFAMGLCAERGLCVAFFTEHGRFLARVEGPVSGNVLLRRRQYRCADEGDDSAALARAFVTAKLANCRTSLQRTLRDRPDAPGSEAVSAAVASLQRMLRRLEQRLPLDTVRGIEGDAARTYFAVTQHLFSAEGFIFQGRSRRPPRDSVNALLSFLYTLLAHDCRGACEANGLDPAVGFLHRDRPGRPGLALDLMEELRPILADRLALALINRRQIHPTGFRNTESGGVVMDDATRKAVLVTYQERKQETFRHPFIDETIGWGLLPHIQAQLLARHLRGDLEEYPAYFWKIGSLRYDGACDLRREHPGRRRPPPAPPSRPRL